MTCRALVSAATRTVATRCRSCARPGHGDRTQRQGFAYSAGQHLQQGQLARRVDRCDRGCDGGCGVFPLVTVDLERVAHGQLPGLPCGRGASPVSAGCGVDGNTKMPKPIACLWSASLPGLIGGRWLPGLWCALPAGGIGLATTIDLSV